MILFYTIEDAEQFIKEVQAEELICILEGAD